MIYQIQAVTWRGGVAHQQDAVLISHYYKAKRFCAAVAHGVSSSPYAALVGGCILLSKICR